jgi:hypothetical protein
MLVAAVLSGACSTYHYRSAEIKRSFSEADYEMALERIERIDRGRSELLYLYEKGLTLHYGDRFEDSNEAFERAELLLEELYTKSVSRELAALAISDNIAKYRGESYEAVIVNYYKILNYLYLGDLDGALVECRRVNRKLEYLRDTEGIFFSNDPFIQYLTGMVYREAKELNDADVSLRVAIDEYQELSEAYGIDVPHLLSCDAQETARLLGEATAVDTTTVRCPRYPPPDHGVLNLFLESGYVAHKQERKIVLPIFKEDDTDDLEALAIVLAEREGVAVTTYRGNAKVDYVLKVAMPVLVPTPVPWDYAELRPLARTPVASAESGDSAATGTPAIENAVVRAHVVENIDAYSAAAFEESYGKVLFRTIVRALSKYAAKKGASRKDETLGWLVNWFNVASESADTRGWTTLPEKILMARLVLPGGEYDLQVDLFDAWGRHIDRLLIEGVFVEADRTTFLNHRIF